MSIIDELTAILPVRWEHANRFGLDVYFWFFKGVRVAVRDVRRFGFDAEIAIGVTPAGRYQNHIETSSDTKPPGELLSSLLDAHPWIRELAMRDRILGVVRGARAVECAHYSHIIAACEDGRISHALMDSLLASAVQIYPESIAIGRAGSMHYLDCPPGSYKAAEYRRIGPRPDAGTLTEEVWI